MRTSGIVSRSEPPTFTVILVIAARALTSGWIIATAEVLADELAKFILICCGTMSGRSRRALV
jgi:hypothetical protein